MSVSAAASPIPSAIARWLAGEFAFVGTDGMGPDVAQGLDRFMLCKSSQRDCHRLIQVVVPLACSIGLGIPDEMHNLASDL